MIRVLTDKFPSRLFLMVIFLTLTPGIMAMLYAQANAPIELINADTSTGKVGPDGELIRILEGHVHIRQDTVEIYCDRATHYPERGEVVLNGAVKVIRGRETLTANRVTYHQKNEMAVASGQVHLLRPGQEMRSRFLRYFYRNDRALAWGDLWLKDIANNSVVTADSGRFSPEANRSEVVGNAHMRQVDSTGTDTLHIYAHRLRYRFGDKREAVGTGEVRIVRGDLVAECDSALYAIDEEVAFLEIKPRAQQAENNLSGTQMELNFRENRLQRIEVRGEAKVTSEVDSLGEKINSLDGKTITAYISGQELTELKAVDNARSLYYISDKNGEQGVNNASADTIRIFFKAGKLDVISVKGGSQGIYYPPELQNKVKAAKPARP
ncbi:MAG: hypothetical protein KDI06_05195 [Calditrichaeota bacterium]|nr:hypothetical protein [Calditrichota bacterium]